MDKYEVGTRPEEVTPKVCERCRMLVWELNFAERPVLVQPKVVIVISRQEGFIEAFLPHADFCNSIEN